MWLASHKNPSVTERPRNSWWSSCWQWWWWLIDEGVGCNAGKDCKTNTFDMITLGVKWQKRSPHSGNDCLLNTKSGRGFVLGGKKRTDRMPIWWGLIFWWGEPYQWIVNNDFSVTNFSRVTQLTSEVVQSLEFFFSEVWPLRIFVSLWPFTSVPRKRMDDRRMSLLQLIKENNVRWVSSLF